jgi:hypothetical protein
VNAPHRREDMISIFAKPVQLNLSMKAIFCTVGTNFGCRNGDLHLRRAKDRWKAGAFVTWRRAAAGHSICVYHCFI